MADQLQLRGGDQVSAEAFVGANRELIVDITNNVLSLHDGVTSGGHPLAKISDLTTLRSSIRSAVDGSTDYSSLKAALLAALADE